MSPSDKSQEDILDLADAKNESGDALGALKIIIQAMDDDPTWGLAKAHAAKYSFGAGLYDDCIKFSDEVISMRPKSSIGYYYKARALHESGRREEALEFYRRGLLCGSRKQEDATYHLGQCLLDMGRFQEAKDTFLSLVQYKDDQSWYAVHARFKIGLCSMKLGQDVEAIKYFSEHLHKYPNCDVTIRNLKILKQSSGVAFPPVDDP